MKRLFCLLILFLFLIPSCKSVDTLLQKKDVKLTRDLCESKKGKARSNCFEKLADYHLSKKDYNTAAGIYRKLADETGIKGYYTRAADAYAHNGKLESAVRFYMKAENHSKAKKTMREYLNKNRKNDKYKNHKFISRYCEKLGLTNEYERLAEIAVSQKNFKAAASYRKIIKEKQKSLKMWEKEGFKNLAKKNYRKAADFFLKAKKPLLSKDAYISGAENALKRKNPKYKYAMKNYQLAGIEERGKKRVVMVMINRHQFSQAFKLAKTISSDFNSEALTAAGDVNLSLDLGKSVRYYKKAGLNNYQCRIGDYFLKGKHPDFKKAESWYSKPSDPSCKSGLLLKALQINDTKRIKQYSGGSKDKNVLNKIAENAEIGRASCRERV